MIINDKGRWNAFLNVPYIHNGQGTPGDSYTVLIEGFQDIGNGRFYYRGGQRLTLGDDLIWRVAVTGTINNSPGSPATPVPESKSFISKTVGSATRSAVITYGGDGSIISAIDVPISVTSLSSFSANAPILYNSSTGVIGITKASSTTDGYLSHTDWNTFNNKLSTAITSLNGLTGATQTFTNDTNVTIVSSGTAHVITWLGTLADSRIASASAWNAKQAALSGSGIVKSVSGTISYISGTSSQFVKADGSLDSTTYLSSIPTLDQVLTAGALSTTTLKIQDSLSSPLFSAWHTNSSFAVRYNGQTQSALSGTGSGGVGVLQLFSGSNALTIQPGTITGSWTQSLPNKAGTFAMLSDLTSGTITSITAGTGLSGGTITTSGTISMPNTGTAGTYGSATQVPVITTDAQGRVTAVTNTSISAGTVTSVATDATLTGGPITTTGTLGINLANANTWTAKQIYNFTLGNTPDYALFLTNGANATSTVNLQYSPYLQFRCSGWNSSLSSAANGFGRVGLQPQSAGGATSQYTMNFDTSPDGASWTTWAKYLPSATTLTFTGGTTLANVGTLSNAANLTITANTTITLNANNITLPVAKKLNITTGTNAIIGTATLSSGTVTISTTAVTASSIIWVQYQSGGTLSGATLTRGIRVSTQTVGTSFVIVAETAPGTTNTSDNSPVQWWIIN